MICLTFDTDYIDAARMEEFISAVDLPVPSTFFCVEPYAALEATGHELCPHPFLDLDRDWRAELRAQRELFPDAAGCRPHSCLYSHLIAVKLTELGFRYVSAQAAESATPRPFREPWGVWQVPIFYMDNADFSRLRWWRGRADPPFSEEAFEIAAGGQGVYVFAFHPIHILMNTPDPQYYLDRREAFLQGEDLGSLRFDGYGTADFFKQACELDTEFTTVADAVERSTQDEAIVRSQSIR